MPRLGRFGRQLRSLFFKASVADEVDAELSFHIDMRSRDLEAAGHAHDDATRLAASRLGDVDRLRRSMRDLGEERERAAGRREWMAELVQDARFSLRNMAKAPAFTIVAVGTLALGIAGTTAIFSAVRAVVLRPWPWAAPERTVVVAERWQSRDGSVAPGNFVEIQAATSSFEALAAEQFDNFALGDMGTPERVLGGRVTADFFAVFGVPLLHGRAPTVAEDTPGNEHVVVLGEGLWRRRYGGDPAIVGRDIRINGQPYAVIGVMPASFDPSLSSEQLWVPVAFTAERRAMHDEHYLEAFGLLKPGVTIAQADAAMKAAMADLVRRFPQENGDRTGAIYQLGPYLVGDVGAQLWLLLGAVGLVLLIACGNVANLLLARGAARARELALRAALGAGRGRILRQLMTESFLLALIAALVGTLLAAGLMRVLVSAAPGGAFPRLGETRVDGMVLGFALLIAVVATLGSGLLPALRAARSDLQATLRGGSTRGHGAAHDRLRALLVATEVALSLTLLVGAGLLVRSAIHLQQTPTGMNTHDVVAAQLSLPAAAYEAPSRVLQAFTEVTEALRVQPGITHAAAVSVSPLSGSGSDNGLIPEGRPLEAASAINASMRLVTGDYFTTVGVVLRRGRLFTPDDRAGGVRVMIVSERLAAAAWPGEDPIGKRIACCEGAPDDPMWKTVVGVVGDVRSSGPMTEPGPEFYLPMDQSPEAAWTWVRRTMSLVARGDVPFDAVVGAMRTAVRGLDPTLPLFQISTADDLLAKTMAPARFNTLLLGVLAALGCALAVAGIYSVIAYFVTLRTREIGVRMALGARASDVLRLMIGQGLQPVIAGLIAGTLASLAASHLLKGALYGVTATDPATFAAAIGVFVLIALAAIAVPAGRAARVEPTRALRDG